MSYLILGLPTKRTLQQIYKDCGGKNYEKHRQTCLKNKRKRK